MQVQGLQSVSFLRTEIPRLLLDSVLTLSDADSVIQHGLFPHRTGAGAVPVLTYHISPSWIVRSLGAPACP